MNECDRTEQRKRDFFAQSVASTERCLVERFAAASLIFGPFFGEVCIEEEICFGGRDRGDLADWLRRRRWSNFGAETGPISNCRMVWILALRCLDVLTR
ncbi:hypothetical protein Enr13x_21810 [Stieleria neptunia]|uniref:Uncharacterized protein n=1 Tax=Stieleria neptunia TaxID=2527979 RepID=A0A518HNA0_9BACT|nr:hypothetical protein Enr13x_21810 [Stieleria neptunia]